MTAIDIDLIVSRLENEPRKLLSGQDVAYVLRAFREKCAEVERLRGTCEWQLENDRKQTENAARLIAENRHLRAALRQILEDPEATIFDSHRDDGWAALGTNP